MNIDAPEYTMTPGGGCNDCTSPTFGLDREQNQLVKNGFGFNSSFTDVANFHSEFTLIETQTNVPNTITLKAYENSGVENIKLIQVGFGVKEVGTPLSESESLVEFWFDKGTIENVIQRDSNFEENKIKIMSNSTKTTTCNDNSDAQCLELQFEFQYLTAHGYDTIVISAMDHKRNTSNIYVNDGVSVVDTSREQRLELQPEPRRDRTDNVMTRYNSNFEKLVDLEKVKALNQFNSTRISNFG